MEPIVLVHGGAGDIMSSRVPAKISGVKASVQKGYEILQKGGSVLDAVEAAVRIMEDDEAFNAGNGNISLSDMVVFIFIIFFACDRIRFGVKFGRRSRNGCPHNGRSYIERRSSYSRKRYSQSHKVDIEVDFQEWLLRSIIFSLARLVMEKTRHVLFAGEGANKLAEEFGIPRLTPGSLVSEHAKEALEHYKKTGYVRSEIGPENATVYLFPIFLERFLRANYVGQR